MTILLSHFYYFYFSIIGVYIIFMPKVLSWTGYSASEIGILFAASPLIRFLAPFLFIKFIKLNITTFNISIIIMILSSMAFYVWIDDFYKLLLANIGLGFGLSIILPYVEVIALENLGREKYGKVRLFGSLGFIIVSLVLVKYLDSAVVALYYLIALSLLTAVFAFSIARLSGKKTDDKKEEVANDIYLVRDGYLWIGLMLMQVSFGAFYNFFTIYETDHGVSLDMTIYLWSFGVVIEIVMLFFQGILLRNNLLLILQITTFSAVIRWFLVYIYPQNLIVLFFTQTLHALSFALFYSAAISYLHQLYKHKALAQQFFSGITFGLGGVLGALSSGYIYEYYPKYLFLSSSLIALTACVFLYLWRVKHSRV